MSRIELFDFWKQSGLSADTAEKFVGSLDDKEVSAFIEDCDNCIAKTDSDGLTGNSEFSFVATNGLSGDRSTCASLDCRVSRSLSLANYAAFYADAVLVRNPFDHWDSSRVKYEDYLRAELVNDIKVLSGVRPLFEAGIFHFSKVEKHFCVDCFQNMVEEKTELRERNDFAVHFYRDQLLARTNIQLTTKFGPPVVLVNGDSEILEHGELVRPLTDALNDKLGEFMNRGKIPDQVLVQSGVLAELINPLFSDFLMQDWYSKHSGYNLLTDKKVHIDLARSLGPSKVQISAPVQIPIGTDPGKLLKLRESEGESFEIFRHEFTKVLRCASKLPQNQIDEMLSDQVFPELKRIELLFRRNKKHLQQKFGSEILISSSLIWAGLYSGILPADIGPLLSALGGFSLVQTTATRVVEALQTPDVVRHEPYYFLWKATR